MDRSEAEGLKPFATKRQAEYLDALVTHGSHRNAAQALGVTKTTVTDAIGAVQRKAAMRGFSPAHDMVHTVPPGYHVKGTSTLYTYGEDGQKIAAQWLKSERSKETNDRLLREWIEDLCDEVKPRKPITSPPPKPEDRQPVFILGDPHAGLLAWGEETGEDYDLSTWSAEHRRAMETLVTDAPEAHHAVIINLGDYFHADNHKSQTTSGNILDVDTRHAKVFREGCATFENMIETCLKKFPELTVYITKGNHDPESSFALAEVLRALYRNEGRVTIKGGIKAREYHTFGINLLGITHGDKTKPKDMPAVMAAEAPELWGKAKCRRAVCGHFHHQQRIEYPGCIVEVFPTIARNDAWHTGEGYISEKAMSCMILHREEGEKGRLWENLTFRKKDAA